MNSENKRRSAMKKVTITRNYYSVADRGCAIVVTSKGITAFRPGNPDVSIANKISGQTTRALVAAYNRSNGDSDAVAEAARIATGSSWQAVEVNVEELRAEAARLEERLAEIKKILAAESE
jgi:predicted ATP-grasp superfamily ATP-dependent carboligase